MGSSSIWVSAYSTPETFITACRREHSSSFRRCPELLNCSYLPPRQHREALPALCGNRTMTPNRIHTLGSYIIRSVSFISWIISDNWPRSRLSRQSLHEPSLLRAVGKVNMMCLSKHRGDILQDRIDPFPQDPLEALAAGVIRGGIPEGYGTKVLRERRHAALDGPRLRQRPEVDAVKRPDRLAEHRGHAVGFPLGAVSW